FPWCSSGCRRDGVGGAPPWRLCRRRLRVSALAHLQFEDAERRTIGERTRQERHRHVVDLHAALGRALELSAMRMAVKHHRDWIAADRLLEAARAEERINLERFAFDGLQNWRVVQQRDEMLAAQARECGLEL